MTATPERFLGIDFSGGAAPWRPRCSRPTVWIATVDGDALVDLRPVQALNGDREPFNRLIARLRRDDFAAAGIDAPFSLPAPHMPDDHAALLQAIRDMPPADDRPFPRGAALLDYARSLAPLESAKPLRLTETLWRQRGINVRSALWNGARGGAPFAAACLALLACAGRPVWPWATGPGLMVEAFPAAQVKQWLGRVPPYSKPEQSAARAEIVTAIKGRIALPFALRATMLAVPDALDAVLAAFGAMAVVHDTLSEPLPNNAQAEGAIAVHR